VKLRVALGMLLLAVVGGGCGRHASAHEVRPKLFSSVGYPCVLRDQTGFQLVLTACPHRIVSLAPSNTEIVYDLGAQDQIVAVTTADDYPASVKRKPKVGPMMNASVETILAYHPDLVLAFGGLNDLEIGPLRRLHVPTLVVNPHNLGEVYASILLIGRAIGKEEAANRLVRAMQGRLRHIKRIVARAKRRPKVLMIYQLNPIYTTGPNSFIDDAIECAGGRNAVLKLPAENTLSPEEVVLAQPDVIVCGLDLVPYVMRMPGWKESVPAVRYRRFFPDDSPKGTLVRPTPRLVDGIARLAHFLHPELFVKETKHGHTTIGG